MSGGPGHQRGPGAAAATTCPAARTAGPHWPRVQAAGNRAEQKRLSLSGLLLEMDDVLYDATLWRRWLWHLVLRMGRRLDYDEFSRTWERQYLPEVHRGRRERHEALEAFLVSMGLGRPQIDEVHAASPAQRRELESTLHPLPGVRATLARLAAEGVVLGVLANSDDTSESLRGRLTRLGLANGLRAVVSSRELAPFAMPDGECYRAGLTALGLAADETAFVGRRADRLAGASAAGLATIAVNREPGATADVCLARFAEMGEVVGKCGVRSAECGVGSKHGG